LNKIFLSIDLDDWYHTPAITGSSFAMYKSVDDFFKDWNERFDYITDSTLKTLELLKKHNITATFFVIADQVERYPKIMKALKESKHEIACHSLHHQVPFDTKTKELIQSKEDWKSDLIQSKSILENYFEREIIGYRAPGAYFANWMIPILEECGFKYDSSVSDNSLYNKTNVELKNIPQNPYLINSNDLSALNPDTELMEFPWANYNILGYKLPVAGAYFFRLFGYYFFKHVINSNLEKGNTMFYFHSLELTEDKIPLENNKKRPLYWINKGEKTYRNLDRLFSSYYNFAGYLVNSK
jgi:peptidoglycan/xylan/chitin deacetylase (PgdA/CDA1 family)